MKELFDKLILRIAFTLFILLILHLYKYAHSVLYPSARLQIFKKFHPSKNPSDTLHLFSRILGIGIIFSGFQFNMVHGIYMALLDFFILGVMASSVFLVSMYIIESITLYNFEYNDEILKRKNMAYALMSLAHSLAIGYILKIVIAISSGSIVMFFFLWLFAMVLIGFASKSFPLISKLSFNRLLIQKNMSIGLSYLGYTLGCACIISSSLNHPLHEVKWYSIQVILKILLSLIIIPIFREGLIRIFKIQKEKEIEDNNDFNLGYGVYEGVMFFTACFLTIVITENIFFGTFYPG